MRRSASASSREPDVSALRFGQHREPRDDVSPGLVGMVGVRIEPASRHGAITVGLAGLAGLNRRGRLRGQAGAIGRIDRIERQQMHGRGIPFIEFRPPVAFADEHLLAYGAGRVGQPVVCFDSYGHERQCNASR